MLLSEDTRMPEFFAEYKYIFLFLGLIVAGEAVLIPSIYFSFAGKLDLPTVVIVAFTATILSDALWHFLGKWSGGKNGIRRKFLGNPNIKNFSAYFLRHGFAALFFSKFIYGTRVAAQVLSGINKMRFRNYLAVNAAATTAWIFCLTLLGAGFSAGINELSSTVRVAEQFIGFAASLLALLFLIKHFMEKTWFPQ